MSTKPGQGEQNESGYILVVSLVVMLLMAIIALSMLGSNTIQELIAGNIADKTRAQQAANSALINAEQWLTAYSGNSTMSYAGPNNTYGGAGHLGIAGQGCATSQTAGTTSTLPVICDAASPVSGTFNPNNLALPVGNAAAIGVIYSPSNMTISTSGGVNTYYQYPRYYIQYISQIQNNGVLYKITAAGYGGSQNAVAIVQAYYWVHGSANSLMGN
jgi:type IV pilus assembly protein PilX